MTRVAMLLFKHIFDPQVRDKNPAVLSLLVQLSEKQTLPEELPQVSVLASTQQLIDFNQ